MIVFDASTADSLWNIISHGGALGVLVVVLWAIITGKLVPKPYFDAAVKDRDDWKDIALTGTSITEKAVEKVTRP